MAAFAAQETQPLLAPFHTAQDEQQHAQGDTPNTLTADFDPAGDPDNPQDWPKPHKWIIVALLAFTAFTVTFTCISVVPVANRITKDLSPPGSPPDPTASVLLVTIWELGEAAGPLLIAPLSETIGRYPVLLGANALFILSCALAALVRSSPQLFIAARFLTGVAVATNVLNPAIVGDLFVSEERGAPMSVLAFAPVVGAAIGPLVSGAVSETLGWRSVIWTSTVLAGGCQVLLLLVFRETYKIVILRRRADKIAAGAGRAVVVGIAYDDESVEKGWRTMREQALRPLVVLFGSGVLFSMAIFGAVCFSFFYIYSVTLDNILEGRYGLSPAQAGASYILFSAGSIVAAIFCHATLDPIYIRMKAANGGVGRPEFRLPLVVVGSVTLPFALALYGWIAAFQWHLAFLLFSVWLIGLTLFLTFLPLISYVVDAFGVYSASAMTGVIILRCIVATFLPMATTPIIASVGYGWGFTALGSLCLVLSPVPMLVWRYGHRWRQRSKYSRSL